MRWNDRKWKEQEKESKSSKQPASQQYIFQYKIQSIVPNTFANKESFAQENSLHNQLKHFMYSPSIVEGGLLITTPNYLYVLKHFKQYTAKQ